MHPSSSRNQREWVGSLISMEETFSGSPYILAIIKVAFVLFFLHRQDIFPGERCIPAKSKTTKGSADDNLRDIVTSMERDLSASGIVVLSNLMPSIRSLFPHILRRVVSDPDLSALGGEQTQPSHNSGQGNVVRDDEDTTASSAESSTNRLHHLFRRLVHAISSPEHPLFICLDDLQWADRGSCE